MVRAAGRTDARAVDFRAQFGANLRAARQEAGLSQEQLGLRAEVHPVEVSRLETGGRDPKLSTVLRLEKALDLEHGTLLRKIRTDG